MTAPDTYRVFLSAVTRELGSHRKEVARVLRRKEIEVIAQREAYGLEVLDAVLLAAYLHGLAGDLAVQRMGEQALAAGDLLESLPAAFARLAL